MPFAPKLRSGFLYYTALNSKKLIILPYCFPTKLASAKKFVHIKTYNSKIDRSGLVDASGNVAMSITANGFEMISIKFHGVKIVFIYRCRQIRTTEN